VPQYLRYFNQQWVGDHTEEWLRVRRLGARVGLGRIRGEGEVEWAIASSDLGALKGRPDTDEFQHGSGSAVTSTFRANLEAP
jgi:hypothetical protein